MNLLLVVALAHADPYRGPHTEPRPIVVGDYPGEFAAPPVTHFDVALPGEAGQAHTQRSRPVVVDGLVLVGTASQSGLFALDRTSGTQVRRFETSGTVESSPLVSGDTVYLGDAGGKVYAFTRGGELRWTYDTAAPILAAPTLAGGRLFVTNVDDLVVALDAQDGTMIWRHQHRADAFRRAELALYAAPSPVVADDEVYAGFSDGALLALGVETGDPRWRVQVGEGRYPDLVAAPTVAGDLVFASGYFEPLVAIDRASKTVRWTLPHGAAAPAVLVETADGPLLVHPGTDGKLRGVVPATGDVRWTWDSGDSGALTEAVPTALGLIVGSSTGTVSAIVPETGATRWDFTPEFLLSGVALAPTISGRQLLFVTNAGRLYSLRAPMEDAASKRTLLPPPRRHAEKADPASAAAVRN